MGPPMMEITLVKAAGPGDRDRAWLTAGGVARRGPAHVIHDLPHLVVESLFGITDGLWAELAAGSHAAAGQAASARDPKRHKQGRIVSGAAADVPTGQWLTPGHRRAKTITNCVANRWGDGPDTPSGVRDRAAGATRPIAGRPAARGRRRDDRHGHPGRPEPAGALDDSAAGRDAQAFLATGTRLLRHGDGKPAIGR
jgi:hypothetical protein